MQQWDPRWSARPGPPPPAPSPPGWSPAGGPGQWGGPSGGFQPRPRNRGLIIGVVIGCVLLLVAAGGILLVVGRDLVELVTPGVAANRGPAAPSGAVVDIGHGVTVTVPVGWSVDDSDSDNAVLSRDPYRAGRGGLFFGRTSTRQSMAPAALCGDYVNEMALRGMTGVTYTPAKTVKKSSGSTAVECSVSGTATGPFGSGPLAIRSFMAATEDGLYGIGSLHHNPEEAPEREQQDYAFMIDSIWDSMHD